MVRLEWTFFLLLRHGTDAETGDEATKRIECYSSERERASSFIGSFIALQTHSGGGSEAKKKIHITSAATIGST